MPADVLAGEDLVDEDSALRWIHFPTDRAPQGAAIDRLKFDELFVLELGVAFRKRRLERHARRRRARRERRARGASSFASCRSR